MLRLSFRFHCAEERLSNLSNLQPDAVSLVILRC
jgi:hypothetical protein